MTIKRDRALYKYCLITDKLKQDHSAPRFQQTTAALIVGFAEFNYNLDVHTKGNIFIHMWYFSEVLTYWLSSLVI